MSWSNFLIFVWIENLSIDLKYTKGPNTLWKLRCFDKSLDRIKMHFIARTISLVHILRNTIFKDFSPPTYHSGNHPLGNSDQRFLFFSFDGENWTFFVDSIILIFILRSKLYKKDNIMTFFHPKNYTFTLKVWKESTFLHTYETQLNKLFEAFNLKARGSQ